MGDTTLVSLQHPYYDETVDEIDAFPQQIVSNVSGLLRPTTAGGGYGEVEPGRVSTSAAQFYDRDVDGSSPATIDPASLLQYSTWCPPPTAASPSAESVKTPSASVWSGAASNASSPLTSPEVADTHDFEDAPPIHFLEWIETLLVNVPTALNAIQPRKIFPPSDPIQHLHIMSSPTYLSPPLPDEAGHTQPPPQHPNVAVAGTYGQGIGMVVNSLDPAADVCQPGVLLEPRACTVIPDEVKAGGKGGPCPICKKVFSRPSNLVEHVRKKHNGERPYRCPVEGCPKALNGYSRNHDLNHHLVTMHKMEPRSLKKPKSRPLIVACVAWNWYGYFTSAR
ncbi:hypothetical protein C8Q79DRAFT_929103 [Trametes meyenii]|nr:hypothetical protein C8Q79DRAFT_929103 [Trametes meyenii]